MLSQVNPNSIAICLNDQKISYQNLKSMVDDKILGRGPIFLRAQTSIDFIVTVLACLEQKLPCIVIPSNYSSEEVESLKKRVGKEKLHSECAIILLTSGSQGEPKVVQISLKNINANIRAISKCLEFDKIKAQVLFLPLSYSFGLIGQLLVALSLGKTTYIADHFLKVKAIIETHQINMISGVPDHYNTLLKLLKKNTEHITHVISAGAPLSLVARRKLVECFTNATIYNNYGQTELTPRALCLSSKDPNFLTDATGRIVPGLSYRIINSQIEFHGPQVMLGYLGEEPLEDNWLKTGDIAEDNDGLITILGRNDDLIKIDGKRFSLTQIQHAIGDYLEIQDVICIHSLDSNQKITIFLKNYDISSAQISDINKKLGITTTLTNYQKVNEFPKLENGKIDKKALIS